jgi:hypothetical protein
MQENNAENDTNIVTDTQVEHILQLYEIANSIHQYESNGIWNRFNILMSINVFLIGSFSLVFVYATEAHGLLIILAVSGIFMNICGLCIIYQSWKWHQKWINKINVIESKFPNYMTKLFDVNAPNKIRSRVNSRSMVLTIMLSMITMWMAILIWYAIRLL